MNKLLSHRTVQRFVNYTPLMKELVQRDLKVKYRRSVLGYLWSLLNPLLMMCIMTFIFSAFFKSDIPNFSLYLICGQTLWTFFSESTTMAMNSVVANGALIKKVYIPKFIFPISRVMSSFVTMTFSLAAILVVMLFTQARLYWTSLLFPLPLLMLFVFCCGIGLVLAALATYFRDVTHIWGVATTAWMYATPIFYDPKILPENVRNILRLNPMYHMLNTFRELIVYGQLPGVGQWVICAVSAIGMLLVGLWVFAKMQKNFILYI